MNDEEPPFGEITLIGTVHISGESKKNVVNTIHEITPDVVAIELDENRLRSMLNPVENPQTFRDTVSLVTKRKLSVFGCLAYVGLRYLQESIDSDFSAGEADFLPAANKAGELDIPLALIDDVGADRWNNIGEMILPELKLLLSRILSADVEAYRHASRIGEEMVNSPDDIDGPIEFLESMGAEELGMLANTLQNAFPHFYEQLVTERDMLMAGHLFWLSQNGYDTVAVVGKLHTVGISRLLDNPSAIPDHYIKKPVTAEMHIAQ